MTPKFTYQRFKNQKINIRKFKFIDLNCQRFYIFKYKSKSPDNVRQPLTSFDKNNICIEKIVINLVYIQVRKLEMPSPVFCYLFQIIKFEIKKGLLSSLTKTCFISSVTLNRKNNEVFNLI